MRTMRILLTALLVLFGASVANAVVYTDGETTLTWEFTSESELKIEGVGYVPSINSAPWKEHKDNIKKITIGDGITQLDARAFEECIALTSISIPNSLKVVDYDAFARCDKLHECHISSLEDWCKIDFAGINSTPFTALDLLTKILVYILMGH